VEGTASYHTPGTEIVGKTIAGNERVIVIDDLLISPVFIASIDEAKTHYDVRSEYSKQAGAALARAMDKNLAQVGLLAARASATVTGGNGGTSITSATALTSASALETAAFAAAQALDEKDVPEEDRYLYLKPAQYYLLINSARVRSTVTSPETAALLMVRSSVSLAEDREDQQPAATERQHWPRRVSG
jgi:hypothetical protein